MKVLLEKIKNSVRKINTCLINHKKQITDVVAFLTAILGIWDTYYGAPLQQILIKIFVFIGLWFAGRKNDET